MLFSELVFFVLVVKGVRGDSHTEHSSPECKKSYSVIYNRMSPDNDVYSYENKTGGKIKQKTCIKWCNEDERCRSVRFSVTVGWFTGGKKLKECVKYNISVSELKDRDFEIYHEKISDLVPKYYTYDRDCGLIAGYKCTNEYPVSHDGESPDNVKYSFTSVPGTVETTAKTCQDWCNMDLNCKSVLHWISKDSGGCKLYKISVQKLVELGRNDEIKSNVNYPTYKTYDRFCGDHSGSKCTATYFVSHQRERPGNKYRISYHFDLISAQACQDKCTAVDHCWSVTYFIKSSQHHCYLFNISIPTLKYLRRQDDIKPNTEDGAGMAHRYLTYDKNCGELPGTMCTNKYLVSHNRTSPYYEVHSENNPERLVFRYYLMELFPDDNASPETCQGWCNRDVNCRSAGYMVGDDGQGLCAKYNMSVQELKDTGGKFYTEDAVKMPTYITYDRDCDCDYLSSLKGTDECLPVWIVTFDKAACWKEPGCCLVEAGKFANTRNRCVRPGV